MAADASDLTSSVTLLTLTVFGKKNSVCCVKEEWCVQERDVRYIVGRAYRLHGQSVAKASARTDRPG